ncbi:MAG: zinc-ribbon domain-containing protein [Candidatus Deferrimicrobiaceae bacterium]|jgi:hypothetical protein
MMGFGFLFMLLVIAVPILGIVALVIWLGNIIRQVNPFNVNPSPENRGQAEGKGVNRFCSHCGAGLHDEWTHCPQCGATVGS